eukprot:scaffold72339_cov19-Tisochrysis_lutea.AAC.3
MASHEQEHEMWWQCTRVSYAHRRHKMMAVPAPVATGCSGSSAQGSLLHTLEAQHDGSAHSRCYRLPQEYRCTQTLDTQTAETLQGCAALGCTHTHTDTHTHS